tara:strand:+ start:479 stop:814 length:336 start_codon:yes stop_codon:yes gene_type:complete
MSSTFFDIDQQTGIIETFEKEGNKIRIGKKQDVNPFLQSNQLEMANESGNWQGNWHKVASIPPIVIEMWTEELKAKGAPCVNPLDAKNKQWLIAKINSGDWSKLRTKSGNI